MLNVFPKQSDHNFEPNQLASSILIYIEVGGWRSKDLETMLILTIPFRIAFLNVFNHKYAYPCTGNQEKIISLFHISIMKYSLTF